MRRFEPARTGSDQVTAFSELTAVVQDVESFDEGFQRPGSQVSDGQLRANNSRRDPEHDGRFKQVTLSVGAGVEGVRQPTTEVVEVLEGTRLRRTRSSTEIEHLDEHISRHDTYAHRLGFLLLPFDSYI